MIIRDAVYADANTLGLYIFNLHKRYPSMSNIEMLYIAFYMFGNNEMLRRPILFSQYEDMFTTLSNGKSTINLGTMTSYEGAGKYVKVDFDVELLKGCPTVFHKYFALLFVQFEALIVRDEMIQNGEQIDNVNIISDLVQLIPKIRMFLIRGMYNMNCFPNMIREIGIRNNVEAYSTNIKGKEQIKNLSSYLINDHSNTFIQAVNSVIL